MLACPRQPSTAFGGFDPTSHAEYGLTPVNWKYGTANYVQSPLLPLRTFQAPASRDSSRNTSASSGGPLPELVEAASITRSPKSYITRQYSEELKDHARLQYRTCRGIWWELAIYELQRHFLHPSDLTEDEFIDYIGYNEITTWIHVNLTRFSHRVAARRQELHQELTVAGISPGRLPSLEMYEMMGPAQRQAFISEFRRREALVEAYNRAKTDITPPPVEVEEPRGGVEVKEPQKPVSLKNEDSIHSSQHTIKANRILESLRSVFSNRSSKDCGERSGTVVSSEEERPLRKTPSRLYRTLGSLRGLPLGLSSRRKRHTDRST